MNEYNPIQRQAEKRALIKRLVTRVVLLTVIAIVFTIFYALAMKKNKVSFDFETLFFCFCYEFFKFIHR